MQGELRVSKEYMSRLQNVHAQLSLCTDDDGRRCTSARSPHVGSGARWSSRIVLKCRDECCDEKRYENRVERGFEFKCVFKSRLDVRAGCPHQCCSEHGTYECRQRQIHHAVDANHTVEVWQTTNSYNESRQGEHRSNCGNWRNAI